MILHRIICKKVAVSKIIGSHRGYIGMHWKHKQVTMHPSVAYYTCPNDTCNKLVTHEVVHVSDDLKHDAHLVKRFHTKTIDVIKSQNIPIH